MEKEPAKRMSQRKEKLTTALQSVIDGIQHHYVEEYSVMIESPPVEALGNRFGPGDLEQGDDIYYKINIHLSRRPNET